MYLKAFPNCQYHRHMKDKKLNMLTKLVVDLLNQKEDCFKTIVAEVTPLGWERTKWASSKRGTVDWCFVLMWVWFAFPMTFSLAPNQTKYFWQGCIKDGNLTRNFDVLAKQLMSQAELDKYINMKQNTPCDKIFEYMIDLIAQFTLSIQVFIFFISF